MVEVGMLKTFLVLLCSFFALFIFACDNQEAELVITKTQQPHKAQPVAIDKEVTADNSKPLIQVSPEDIVEILVRQDGAPGMYLGDDGELHGFYVDLERMIMEEMGQAYHLKGYDDVGPAAQWLKTGVSHIALAAPDIVDYRSFLNLSIPYEVLHYVTFVHKGNREIEGDTRENILKSLHGKKVGVQTRGHIYQALREIREIELIEYPTTTKALEDLNKGLLDAVPDVKRIGIYYSSLYNWDVVPVGTPIISHKLTTAFSRVYDESLINRYNTALKTIQSDGRFDTLYESYFGPMSDEDRP